MTDLVLPSAAPMESYIDETVAALAEMLEDTPADVLAGFDFSAQGVWTFARPGCPPLKLEPHRPSRAGSHRDRLLSTAICGGAEGTHPPF